MSPPPGNRFEIGSLIVALQTSTGAAAFLLSELCIDIAVAIVTLNCGSVHLMRKLHRTVMSEKVVELLADLKYPLGSAPDIQWVFNLDCTADIPDTVAGARMKLTFQEAKM
jgi:hypothetical protein